MIITYARTAPPEQFSSAIFLAGPTPRGSNAASWRPDALDILRASGFDGVVFVPEDEAGGMSGTYEAQVEWEERCLKMSDCIVFWIPRELSTMPGFTTNIEWGVWHDSGRAVFGAPKDAPKMRYLRHYAEKYRVPHAETLEETLAAALEMVGEGAQRAGGERDIPLHIWRRPGFQSWYRALLAAGNRLDGADLEWQYRGGPGRRFLFCWALRVNVHVTSEGRNKRGEFVLTRPDIASVLAYYPGETLMDCRIVMVREFRSPGVSADGFVHELPGGSDPHANAGAEVAADELVQETGVRVDASRLRPCATRQCFATLMSHRAHLFAVELTKEEFATFRAEEGHMHGEHASERTVVELFTVRELLANELIDWTHLGMILSVLVERD